MPVTVATWYITIIPPRTAAGEDSATKIGAVTIDTPIVTPRKKRAVSRKTRLDATLLRTAKAA
jgi:hypothetical protein